MKIIQSKNNKKLAQQDITLLLDVEKYITGANAHAIRQILQGYNTASIALDGKHTLSDKERQYFIDKKNNSEKKLREFVGIERGKWLKSRDF